MASPGIKQRLRNSDTLAGYLALIPAAVLVQAVAESGAGWVVIDQEIGAAGPKRLLATITATADTLCGPLMRVSTTDQAQVKLALDLGKASFNRLTH